jgi:soluble lytic murein transglycosylase-like protein
LWVALALVAQLTPVTPQTGAAPGPDASAEMPSEDILGLVRREAAANQLSPEFAEALVAVLSGFDPAAQGPFNKIGLMQIPMATARMLGFKGSEADLRDPETNVRLGMAHLRRA